MRHRSTFVAAALSASIVSAVPVSAQSHSVHFQEREYGANTSADHRTSNGVRVYDPHAANVRPELALPPNLDVQGVHRSMVEWMLQRSPTFRRQCLRIAAAPSLTVTIRNRPVSGPDRVRARTQFFTSPSGRRHAVVELIDTRDRAELIAHELEHVIEQLDGVDLHVQAAAASTGVRQCEGGAFETTRAIRVGRAVAAETAGVRR